MNKQELEALLSTVTSDRVSELVLELEPQQAKANRGTVPLYEVLEALSQGQLVRQAPERFRIEVGLRKAVIAAVDQVEGMTFVEGDS